MLPPASVTSSLCQACGVCCSYYRVSFYWGETTASGYGSVPVELTRKLTPHHVAMTGTDITPARCIALEGAVGKSVTCSIYSSRPTPCREFKLSMEDGVPNPNCDKARMAYGIPAISSIETEYLVQGHSSELSESFVTVT